MIINKLVHDVKMKNYISDNIFLFILAIKVKDVTINLAQALSEKMDTHFIVNFCHLFLKNRVLPLRLVIGYSRILLNGASFAFNTCYFNDYIMQCYRHLFDKSSALPSTLIQVDILSIIKVIEELDCFKNKSQVTKKFFVQSITYLSTAKDLQEFEATCVSLFIVIFSPFESDFTKQHRNDILSKIDVVNVQEKNCLYENLIAPQFSDNIFSYLTVTENNLPEYAVDLVEFVERLEKRQYVCVNHLKTM